MKKFTRFLLLFTLGMVMVWSAPLTFLQDANAYDGEGAGLKFEGTLVTPGSCQQPAANSIRCTVFVDQESRLELTATSIYSGDVCWSDYVSISAVGFLPADSVFSSATARGTVTTTWIFAPQAVGTYEARFRASIVDEDLSAELSITFEVVLPEFPQIEVSPTSLDFGEIAVGTTAERELTIKNVGDADLWIGDVAIEGGASSPFDLCGIVWTSAPLAPGKETKVKVCFSPETTGSFDDVITISSDDPNRQTVAVPVQGVGAKAPKIEVSPTSLDFGKVPVGDQAPDWLTIKNIGEAELRIDSVTIEGGADSPFDLCGRVWKPDTLSPGGWQTSFTICFSPNSTSVLGILEDNVLIESNDPTTPTVTIPVRGNATKKKSTISCTAMGRPKPGGLTYLHEGVREAEVIVTVEISPPHSGEYTVNISDANGGTHGPFTSNTDANGKDKRLLVVNGTLLDFKLEGTWKCEVSWKGDEEYEGALSQCAFDVSELGSYEGTEAGPTTINPARASNAIDIEYNGFCTQNCSKIVFIQVCSDEVFFTDRSRKALKPSGTGATFAYMDNDAVYVGGGWFTVDYLKPEKDPYYNGDDWVAGCSTLTFDRGKQGTHNTTQTTLANIYDKPSYNMTEINNIFLAAYNKTVLKIMTEFETFAFCVNGTDQGRFYQGIKWRYEQDQAGSKNSTSIEVVSEPSEGFRKALDKWCTNHGFILPKPK